MLKLLYLLLASCTVSQFDTPTPSGKGSADLQDGLRKGNDDNGLTTPSRQIASEILEPSRIPVDILFVVDVSPSMPPDNTQLFQQILPLALKFTQYKWQVAITTSISSDCLRSLVKKSILVDLVKIGYDFHKQTYPSLDDYIRPAAKYEEVMLMATKAIQSKLPLHNALTRCSGKAKKWLRDNSMLAIVLVTDEDVEHHPAGKQCRNRSCIDAFWTQLQKIRKPHITSRIYGFLNYGQARHGSDSPDDVADTNTGYLSWRSPQGEPLFDVHKPLLNDNERISSSDANDVADDFKKWLRKYYIINGTLTANSSLKVTYTDGQVKLLTSADYQVEGNILTLNDSVADDVQSLEITY